MAQLPRYSASERELLRATSRRSAARWVPVLAEVFRPRSVVELGCGSGEWLAAFQAAGVTDVLGLDLPEAAGYGLAIDAERFIGTDLAEPPALGRGFDLVLTMEVAEHLPYHRAPAFVDFVVALASVAVFGAAVPVQGGERHVNEQYPEFWAELFAARGFRPLDCLREMYWTEPDASWFYAQNALVYVDERGLAALPHLAPFADATDATRLTRLHPTGGPAQSAYRRSFERGLAEPAATPAAEQLRLSSLDAARMGYLAGLERGHRTISREHNQYLCALDLLPLRPVHHPSLGVTRPLS